MSAAERLRIPPAPETWRKKAALALGMFLILWWAFVGAQFNVPELFKGIPAVRDILDRMLPPAPGLLMDPKEYALPDPRELSLPKLLLPLPVTAEERKIRDRWWANTFPQTVIGATLQTIQMALAGTFLALLVSLPISFLAARNTVPHHAGLAAAYLAAALMASYGIVVGLLMKIQVSAWLTIAVLLASLLLSYQVVAVLSPTHVIYYTTRALVNFFRAIPEIALGLIFVAAIGLGPFAGTLALAFGTSTILIKLLSEAIEKIDPGVVEAIQATGAHHVQVLSYAVLPQILPDLISFVLYRFEANIRAAAILGVIGAGGIGVLMMEYFRSFQYREASMVVLVLIVLVMSVDYLSASLRKLVI